jgi:hypothetical protein
MFIRSKDIGLQIKAPVLDCDFAIDVAVKDGYRPGWKGCEKREATRAPVMINKRLNN